MRKFSITPRTGLLDIHFSAPFENAKINYVRVTGAGVNLLLTPDKVNDYARAGRADWNRDTGEITMDDLNVLLFALEEFWAAQSK